MASKGKTVRFRDSSLIDNDELRPWTIDLNLEQRLQQESGALDKILLFTTPQKFAGTLANSVLDSAPQEFKEFKSTLEQRIQSRGTVPFESQKLSAKGSTSNSNSTRNSDSSRQLSNRSSRNYSSGRLSGAQTPTTESLQDCFDAADLAYIERIKSSMYANSKRNTMRARTAQTGVLPSIRYSQEPFGPISPSKSKLILTTYHNPRLNPSVSHSKIPAIKSGISSVSRQNQNKNQQELRLQYEYSL